jgi:hypothetical protein
MIGGEGRAAAHGSDAVLVLDDEDDDAAGQLPSLTPSAASRPASAGLCGVPPVSIYSSSLYSTTVLHSRASGSSSHSRTPPTAGSRGVGAASLGGGVDVLELAELLAAVDDATGTDGVGAAARASLHASSPLALSVLACDRPSSGGSIKPGALQGPSRPGSARPATPLKSCLKGGNSSAMGQQQQQSTGGWA